MSMKRRNFLKTALMGGVTAQAAYLMLARDLFAAESGPIVIGHQCDLTGGFSSWGYWHNKSAIKAVEYLNANGGIAGRPVQLVTEDTESDPTVGARKMRSLIQRSRASFIIGSVHSGINLASIPAAKEFRVIYWPTGEATESTGEKGNRWIFRMGTDTYALAAAGAPWAYQSLGKNWTMIFADYAWGWSHYHEHKAVLERMGAAIDDPIPVPLDAKDFVPYLAKVPEKTEVLFSIFFGALSVAFYTQSKAMGFDKRLRRYSIMGTHEAIAPGDIEGASEGVYLVENLPRMLKFKDDEPFRKYRKLIEVDPIQGREVNSNRVVAMSHQWQCWDNIFALKTAIEKAKWKSAKDTPGVVQALEGMAFTNGIGSIQGNKILRKEDHSGVIDCFISQVKNGMIEVQQRVPKEELVKHFKPRFDFSKEKI